MDFAELKILISECSQLEKDALHIHFALLMYLLAMFAFRSNPGSWVPWLFVMGIEFANEGYDLWHQEAHGEPARWGEALKDLWNTMLWPTVLLVLVRRFTRNIDVPGRAGTADASLDPERA